MNRLCKFSAALALALAAATSAQAGFMDSLKGAAADKLGGGGASEGASGSLLSGLGMPAIGGDTAGNVAGVLQYCIKNNYLSASGAEGVKNSLLSKIGLGGKESQDTGFQSGAGGILSGSNGSTFDMGKLKANVKEKACDYVLKNAKSLL